MATKRTDAKADASEKTGEYDRSAQLVAARAIMAAKMAGQSPRQRGDEKTTLALDWVYRWAWASPSTLEIVGGAQRSGLAARLVRRGFLRSTRTESGGAQRGVPACVLTLTESGQAEIERTRAALLPYDRDPHRIRQDQLRHYQLAQMATAKALQSHAISGFLTEKEMQAGSASGIKQPDAVWLMLDGSRMGIEVELTAKWGRDLDVFIRACLLALAILEPGQLGRFQKIAVVSDSPAIIKRYRDAFTPGRTYQRWEKDGRGYWRSVEALTVPDWIKGRMVWRSIGD